MRKVFNKLKKELAWKTAAWIYFNAKLQEINNFCYEHTEMFENEYEYEFLEHYHNFFAKKITRFSREANTLMNLASDAELEELVYYYLGIIKRKDRNKKWHGEQQLRD